VKKNEDNRTIAVVGGHFSPAYALIEALQEQKIPVTFIGKTDSFTGISSPSLEHRLIVHIPNVIFYPFDSGRFNTKTSNNNIGKQLILFVRAIVKAWYILHTTKPAKVVVFGGYLAFPVALCAYIMGIPIYLHEQTAAPGKATLFIARIAKKIFVAFPQAKKHFQSAIIVGNPYHSEFLSVQKPTWYTHVPDKPLLLIMGGSSGSHQINVLLENNLTELSKNYHIIHQVGMNEYGDYERLKKHANARYIPVPFLLPNEHGFLFSHAAFAITRAGANTFFLLIHYALPAVLVPLPFASNDEQHIHAQIIAHAGAGTILTPHDDIMQIVHNLARNKHVFRRNFTKLNYYKNLVVPPQQLLHEIIAK